MRDIERLAQQGRQILNAAGIRVDGQTLHHYAVQFLKTTDGADWQFWLLTQVNNDPRIGTNAMKEDPAGRRPHKDHTADRAVGAVEKDRGY